MHPNFPGGYLFGNRILGTSILAEFLKKLQWEIQVLQGGTLRPRAPGPEVRFLVDQPPDFLAGRKFTDVHHS